MGDEKTTAPPPPNTNSNSNSNSSNGTVPSPRPRPPLSPKSTTTPNPNNNTYPTTFIQADTHSFKQVVQMLTGSPPEITATKQPNGTQQKPPAIKKPAFKLYERRPSMKNLKMIAPLIPTFSNVLLHSPRQMHVPDILSPSVLDFPSLALSPVTPLSPDPFNRVRVESGEDRGFGFCLQPSPRGSEPPKLLPLFPLSSPRMGSGSGSESEFSRMESGRG